MLAVRVLDGNLRRRLFVVGLLLGIALLAGTELLQSFRQCFLDERLALRGERLASLRVFPAIEIFPPVDPGLVHTGVIGKRIAAPEHKIGVLAGFERARLRVDAQLPRGIDRHQFQRVFRREPAVFHRLRGFGVEPACEIRAIGVDRGHHALALHHGGVMRNGVVDLKLVAPPIGKRRTAHAIFGHHVGDFVALENVLQRADLDLELARHAQERQNFILSIGMAMDQSLAAQDFGDRLQLEIAPNRQALFLFQRCIVFLGRAKTVAHDLLDAHARLWVTRIEFVAPVRLLNVFAEREFHSRHRLRKFQFFRERAPAEFDHLVLAAHRIRGAVEDIRRRHAAGQLAVKSDVGRVDHITDAHLAGHRVAGFVHASANRGVRMAIDNSWRDVHSLAVDNRRAAGSFQARADRGDLPARHQQIRILQRALRTRRPDRRAVNENAFRLFRQRRAAERSGWIGLGKIERLIERRRSLVRLFHGRICGRPLRAPANIRRAGRFAASGHGFARSLAGQPDRAFAFLE